jgi:hypothetical protein
VIPVLAIIAGVIYLAVRSARRDRSAVPEIGPVGWVSGTRWATVVPLARVELRRFLVHPAFLVGVALTPAILRLGTVPDESDTWLGLSTGIALALAPLGWFTIAAAQLVTTRPARTGADALFASLPAPEPTRTAGLLATTIVTAGLVAAVLATLAVALMERGDRVLAGSPDVSEIAAGVFIVAGAVTVGVALGRFLPHPLFAVGGAIAVIMIQARFFEPTSWPWNHDEASPVRFFGFLGRTTSAWPQLEYRPAEWHLIYLAGLIGIMAIVAFARRGVPPTLGVALGLAVLVTAGGAFGQSREPSGRAVAGMVRYLEHPAAYQTCQDTASARYCVFRGRTSGPMIATWDATARAVLALAPTAGRRLEVAERVPTVLGDSNCAPIAFADTLPKAVQNRLAAERVWPDDGVVHPGTGVLPCSDESVDGLFLAVQIGAWSVGLPPSPHGRDERCVADGEARSALALWLGLTATPRGEARLGRILFDEDSDHIRFDGWTDPPMWGVRFSVADARVALDMSRRPTTDVRSAWSRLSSPRAPTSELSALLGLTPRPSPTGAQPTCA